MLRRKKDAIADEAVGPLYDDSLFNPNPWYATLFDDYRKLGDDELAAGEAMIKNLVTGDQERLPLHFIPAHVGA